MAVLPFDEVLASIKTFQFRTSMKNFDISISYMHIIYNLILLPVVPVGKF